LPLTKATPESPLPRSILGPLSDHGRAVGHGANTSSPAQVDRCSFGLTHHFGGSIQQLVAEVRQCSGSGQLLTNHRLVGVRGFRRARPAPTKVIPRIMRVPRASVWPASSSKTNSISPVSFMTRPPLLPSSKALFGPAHPTKPSSRRCEEAVLVRVGDSRGRGCRWTARPRIPVHNTVAHARRSEVARPFRPSGSRLSTEPSRCPPYGTTTVRGRVEQDGARRSITSQSRARFGRYRGTDTDGVPR
jgi:hypothetical protein